MPTFCGYCGERARTSLRELIEDDRHQTWQEKFAQALRAMLFGSVAEVSAALGAAGLRPIAAESVAARKPQDDECASTAPEPCEVL
jgi:hypothetical protein